MERPRFTDHCQILQGKLPRAPDWPTKSVWWLSKPKMTVRVECEGERIVWAAPIVARFVGQRLVNLLHWLGTMPGTLNVEMLASE